LNKEAKQGKKGNFKIKAGNIFMGRNDKIKLKKANPLGDHIRLRKAWISEQQKRERVFRNKLRMFFLWNGFIHQYDQQNLFI
jgi:hypothetical protein